MGALTKGLVLVALLSSGCTSDTFSAGDGGDDAGAADVDGGADAGEARDSALEADPPIEAGAEGCVATTFYLDADHDGYGGTSTTLACAPPGMGWAAQGGDCDDSNPDVHPNQPLYFTTGYVPTGKTTTSFDYDCDGVETESGSSPKAACQVVSLACVGSGYVPATPSRGAGADDYCGSNLQVTCSFQNLVCKAEAPQTTSPIACK